MYGSAAGADTKAGIVAVVVAYDPDPAALGGLLSALGPQVGHTIVVDNSDVERTRAAIGAAAGAAGAELLRIGHNSGIAHAQNAGAARAIELGAKYVLLSDDDSRPAPDMVARLLAAISAKDGATDAASRVAAVGPLVYDDREPGSVLVFRDTTFGPGRAAIVPGEPRVVPVAFLVASGCLIDVDAWRAVGPMREDLFIDHVDLEWGVRARRAGWSLLAIGDALLEHRLGDAVLRPWFLGRRRVHVHSPVRNYYLARNTLLLVIGGQLTIGWRVGYLVWLAKYVAFNAVFVAPRLRRAGMFARALRDALAGRAGPLPAVIAASRAPRADGGPPSITR